MVTEQTKGAKMSVKNPDPLNITEMDRFFELLEAEEIEY